MSFPFDEDPEREARRLERERARQTRREREQTRAEAQERRSERLRSTREALRPRAPEWRPTAPAWWPALHARTVAADRFLTLPMAGLIAFFLLFAITFDNVQIDDDG